MTAALVGSLSAPITSLADEPGLNGTQRDEVLELVESYIINNPQVLAKALERLHEAPDEGNIDRILSHTPDSAKNSFADASQGGAVVINPTGTTTLVVAFDYACPFSRTEAPRIADLLKRRPDVKLIMRDAPILTPESELAARVGQAVARRGSESYMAYYQSLMARQGALSEQNIMDAATQAGADLSQIADLASSSSVMEGVNRNIMMMKQIGVLATPLMMSNGKIRNGALQPIELDALLLGR